MKIRFIIIFLLMILSNMLIGANPENTKEINKKPKQEQTRNTSENKQGTKPATGNSNKNIEEKSQNKALIIDSNTIEKKYSDAIKRIESLEKKISNLKNSDQDKLDNSIDRVYMFLYIISGGFLLVVILISIVFNRYINKKFDDTYDDIDKKIKDINSGKSGKNIDWEHENQLKRIKEEISNLKSKIGKNIIEEKPIKPIIESKINQTQNNQKNKFLFAENPDDLIFSKFGKEPTGNFLYTIDTSKNTFTIDKSLNDLVITSIDKFQHACIIEGNTSNFSRYELIEGKVKKNDDNSWDILEKIKLKLY